MQGMKARLMIYKNVPTKTLMSCSTNHVRHQNLVSSATSARAHHTLAGFARHLLEFNSANVARCKGGKRVCLVQSNFRIIFSSSPDVL